MAILNVADAMANLVTALQAEPTLSGVKVYNGPQIDRSFPEQFIIVGADYSTLDSDILVTRATGAYLTAREGHEETLTISCMLVVNNGRKKPYELGATAYALLKHVEAVIEADSTFANEVGIAWIASHILTYRASDNGGGAAINFTIECKSYS